MAENGTEIVYRDCTLCEAHCGVAVTVDREAGRVLDIRGDENDPMSRGYVCPKSVGLAALSEDPDRLRHPVKRVGEKFVEISWEEAFDLVTSRLLEIREAHGANAIATYLGNPNAHDFASNFSVPPLVRALGTRWRFSATSVDKLPKMVSNHFLFGSAGAFPVPDIDRTDFFLVLGANPLASNGSIMTAPDMRGRLRALRERGINTSALYRSSAVLDFDEWGVEDALRVSPHYYNTKDEIDRLTEALRSLLAHGD